MAMSGVVPGLRDRPGLLADPRDQFKVRSPAAPMGRMCVMQDDARSVPPAGEPVACRR
jgi:hypothetical protein